MRKPHEMKTAETDAIIRMPMGDIYLADGRVLKVTAWEPRVAVDEIISVKIEAYIEGSPGER